MKYPVPVSSKLFEIVCHHKKMFIDVIIGENKVFDIFVFEDVIIWVTRKEDVNFLFDSPGDVAKFTCDLHLVFASYLI